MNTIKKLQKDIQKKEDELINLKKELKNLLDNYSKQKNPNNKEYKK